MAAAQERDFAAALKKELMLQVNQRLYQADVISKTMYEQAKIKIVNSH